MGERHPGYIGPVVDLSPPTEPLKLTGSPIVQADARGSRYNIDLQLSRSMTEFEYDMVGARESSAGMVYAHHDRRDRLTVVQTTVELVRDWADELKSIVAAIEADGEKDRASSQQLAEKTQRDAEDAKREKARRDEAAKDISFD